MSAATRQLGAVFGVAILIAILGPAPGRGSYDSGWWAMAGLALLAVVPGGADRAAAAEPGSRLGAMPPGYREYRPPTGLASVVACVWERESAEYHAQRIVPDACVDLIWLAGGDLVIAGADTGARSVEVAARPAHPESGCVPAPPARSWGCRRRSCAIARSPVSLVWGERGPAAGGGGRRDTRAAAASCWSPRSRGAAPRRTRWCSPPR